MKINDPILQQASNELYSSSSAYKKIYDELNKSPDIYEISFAKIKRNTNGYFDTVSGNITIDKKYSNNSSYYKGTLVEEVVHAYQGYYYGYATNSIRKNASSTIRTTANNESLLSEGDYTMMMEQSYNELNEYVSSNSYYVGSGVSYIEVKAKLIREGIRIQSYSTNRKMNFQIDLGSTGWINFNTFLSNNGKGKIAITSQQQIANFYKLQQSFQTYYKTNAPGKTNYETGAKKQAPEVLNYVF